MARLKNTGIFRVLEFPLLWEGKGAEIDRCTWKAKYPTQQAIDQKRTELGDIGFRCCCRSCRRRAGVLPEDIHYYDEPPFDDGNYLAHGVDECIRRFLLHVLPDGFHRIRHYGLLAGGNRTCNIALARRLLGVPDPAPLSEDNDGAEHPHEDSQWNAVLAAAGA